MSPVAFYEAILVGVENLQAIKGELQLVQALLVGVAVLQLLSLWQRIRALRQVKRQSEMDQAWWRAEYLEGIGKGGRLNGEPYRKEG